MSDSISGDAEGKHPQQGLAKFVHGGVCPTMSNQFGPSAMSTLRFARHGPLNSFDSPLPINLGCVIGSSAIHQTHHHQFLARRVIHPFLVIPTHPSLLATKKSLYAIWAAKSVRAC